MSGKSGTASTLGICSVATSYGEFCGGTTGAWTSIGNIPLDGSDYPGGITRVWIQVVDKLHDGIGYADCYRADSTCLQGQG